MMGLTPHPYSTCFHLIFSHSHFFAHTAYFTQEEKLGNTILNSHGRRTSRRFLCPPPGGPGGFERTDVVSETPPAFEWQSSVGYSLLRWRMRRVPPLRGTNGDVGLHDTAGSIYLRLC